VLPEIVFWFSAAVPVYVYLGFPVVLLLLRPILRRPVKKQAIEPSVSLLIAAYNEAGVIEQKIQNALAGEYPAGRLEIAVASDGSTDGTADRARGLADGNRVRVFAYAHNRGKLHVLNETVPQLRGEIVILSDATSMLYPDAIHRLVSNFADPSVGAVSGLYRVINMEAASIGRSEDFYWKYETFLKTWESELDSCLGSHGSFHAIRKELYPFPQPGTINDDFVIPLSVLKKGFRSVYEPEAVSYEPAQDMTGFGRRVRIMTGNVQQLTEIRALLNPLRPLPLFFFLSHKAGRLAVPFAMVSALLANLFLLRQPLYQFTLILQAGFYALAILGGLLPLRPKFLRVPYYFCMVNTAAFPGIYHALTERRGMAWK